MLACGGLLDTCAAIRAGLVPIWGCDTAELPRQLWQDLTNSPCYGDAFKLNIQSLRKPTVLKSGFPCQDYSGLGSELGGQGKSGNLYAEQAKLILQISPAVAIIEQTDNAININQGKEVKQLISDLQQS